MKRPDDYDLNYLQYFFQAEAMSPMALIGNDATVWGTMLGYRVPADDIITLKPRLESDSISSWISEHAINIIHNTGLAKLMTPDRATGTVAYNDRSIFRITFW